MPQYLSDEEVFGTKGQPQYLDPSEVFGDETAPPEKQPTPGILDTIKNYGLSTLTALGQGTGELGAAAGGMLQDPTSGALSMLTGGAALADRGITGLSNWVSPGSAQLSEPIQRTAQDAAAFASERRAANVDEARRKVGDRSSNILDQTALAGAGLEDVGRRLVQGNKGFDQTNNPELLRQQKALSGAEGFVGNIKAGYDNPLALSNILIRSLPAMLAGLGIGRAAATSVLAGAESAATGAAAKAAAAGLDAEAQSAAATAAVKAVQDQAVARASTAGMLSEAGTSAMQGRESTYQQVAGMPLAELDKVPRYQEIKSTVSDPLQARQIFANEVADQLPLLSGIGTGSGTLLTNKLFGMKLLGGKGVATDATAESLAGVNRMTARDLGLRTAQDTVEEGIQGIPEDAVQFGTSVQADPNQKYDFGGSLAQNLMGGLGMGGAGHGFAYGREKYQDYTANPTKPSESAGSAEANTPVEPAQAATNTAAKQPEVSASEKALLQPVGLTALDRVNELDKESQAASERLAELNDPAGGYGPMFDQERQELTAKSAVLAQERADLSKDWPKSVPGLTSSFSTEAGARVEAQYALMDAADLITSHDEGLRKNPLYPPELQPRERDRAASEMQVSGIVQKLDPARLGLSADAANGAPIVGADGLVESGNARTIALKRVYQANGQKAADYKTFLRDNAAQFGITPEAVDGMAKPVLVRVRSTPVNRAEFARQANASTVAAMAPSEQAKSDANRIDSMEDLTPDDNGDFSNAASRPFVQRFMARLPITEQAGMVDANGALSTTGYARVRNAVLAKAYGDSPVLARMTESMDDNLRNVSRAFLLAAPKVAAMRAAVKDGNRFDADITPDLMSAAEELSKIKGEGGSVQDALAQVDLMGEQRTPEAAQLLQFLNDNMRRPRRMADFIGAYMDALDAAGDPNQGSLLGDTQAPAKQDLLKAAERATQNEAENNGTTPAGAAPQDSGQAGQKPGAAQSGGSSTQGDGTDTGHAAQGKQDSRAEAVGEFKSALADLAQIASKHTRIAMMPEDTPNLMPTLVKLSSAGIKLLGTDLKALKSWIKAQLKAMPEFKTFWNKIDDKLYQKAALQALDAMKAPAQTGLFDSPVRADEAMQQGLFDAPAEPAKPAQPAAQEATKEFTAIKRGDFYEVEGDNAKEAATILNLTLTKNRAGVPMVGWPYHAHEQTVAALAAKGITVNTGDSQKPAQADKPATGPAMFSRGAERKSSVLSKYGKFKSWPYYKVWSREEYNDVVSLLPAHYRNDSHWREPLPAKDWYVLAAEKVIPEINALNDSLGTPGAFLLDDLGNITANYNKAPAQAILGAAKDLADKYQLGLYVTNVATSWMQPMMDKGFTPELGLAAVLQRSARENAADAKAQLAANQSPNRTPDSIYAMDAMNHGTVMSYKPRGFSPQIMFSRTDKGAPTLIIQHNLTEENLLHADRMGGIPVPSLAVTQAAHPLENFGEITLIGGSNMADPKGYAATKVFGADIYSPRYPMVTYVVDYKDRARLNEKLKPFQKLTGAREIDGDSIQSDGKKALSENSALMAQFLTEKGIKPLIVKEDPVISIPQKMKMVKAGLGKYLKSTDWTVLVKDEKFKELAIAYQDQNAIEAYMGVGYTEAEAIQASKNDEKNVGRVIMETARQIADNANQPKGAPSRYKTTDALRKQIDSRKLVDEFDAYVDRTMKSLNPDEKLFQGFTNMGYRKYIPHTLDNVIKILKKDMRGGEGFNYGVGSVRSRFTPQFKSIAEIQKAKGRLMDEKSFDLVKEDVNEELSTITESLRSYHGASDRMGFGDTVTSTLYDSAKMGLTKALKENGFEDVPQDVKEHVSEFLGKLRNMPTAYFEAKILRAVDLSEFKGAVVPKETSKEAISALNRRGVTNIKYYDKNVTGERAAKIQELAKESDLMFSRANFYYSALSREIEGAKTNAAPAIGWLAAIKGMVNKGAVKADEVEWSGLEDWIKLQTGKVTKEQVTAYLDANGVQVQETVLGTPPRYDRELGTIEDGANPKYGNYTLPGGKNYREVLLTLPEAHIEEAGFRKYQSELRQKYGSDVAILRDGTSEENAKLEALGSAIREAHQRATPYKSPHWEQPNVLAHLRVDDRTDADGERVLFVEELQSDWGQEAKKRGIDKTGEKDIFGDAFGTPNAPFIDKTDKWLNLALKRVIKMAVDGGYDKVAFVNGEQSADRYDLSKQISRVEYTDKGVLVATDTNGREAMRETVAEDKIEDYIGKDAARKLLESKPVPDPGRGDISAKTRRIEGDGLKVGGEGMKAFYDSIVPNATKALLKKLGGGQLESVRIATEAEGILYKQARPESVAQRENGAWYIKLADGKERGIFEKRFIAEAALKDSQTMFDAGMPTISQPGFTITPVMREKASGGLPLFAKGQRATGLSVKSVQDITDAIKARWANAPEVVVAQSIDDPAIPQAVRDHDAEQRSQGATGTPEGFFYGGKVYVVANQMNTPGDVIRVMFHEALGHAGLRGVFGTDMNKILRQIVMLRRKDVAAKAEQYGLDMNNPSEALQAAEEVLAEMAQTKPEMGFVKRAIAAIRSWLRKNVPGFEAMKLTDAEIINSYIMPARNFVQSGKSGVVGGVAFIRGTNGSMTNKDVVGNQGGRSADDSTPGALSPVETVKKAAIDAFDTYQKRTGAEGDVSSFEVDDNNTPVPFRAGAAEKELKNLGWDVGTQTAEYASNDASHYITARKLVASDPKYGDEYVTAKVRISNHGNTTKAHDHPDVNIAPGEDIVWDIEEKLNQKITDEGYDLPVIAPSDARLGYAIATEQAQRGKPSDGSGGNSTKNESTAPDSGGAMLSRAPIKGTVTERANQIIATKAATAKPLDAAVQAFTKITGIERATRAIYGRASYLLNRYTPETIKAGMVSDYGVPEAVIDQRALMQGRQRVQLRQAGSLIDKLSTLTRAESRVAYEWMNETDPHTIYTMMQNLPEESVKVLQEVQAMVDKLSREAVRMGQLSQDAYDRNKFAYLRRSYAKYTLTQTEGEKKGRARAISILGDQYKGRGLTESASMEQIKNAAPAWWARKLVEGKADKGLKGEKFIRLERRAASGERTKPLEGMDGKQAGKLKEVAYWPVSQTIPNKFSDWTQAGVFEVRDTKGAHVVLWRDFTKDERENMGEIDEARFAIAKTLHAMIHDVEVGRYLEWLAHNYAKKEGETIPGVVVQSENSKIPEYGMTFKPGEWVRVPDSKIEGTSVLKYGTLAGRYLPGPIWNDLRQIVGGQFHPFGGTYATILSFWKTSKTALSPAVHMNNVMSNFVMADWHDVTAGHTAKALRILLGAHGQDGKGALGTAGNLLAGGLGVADREASQEIMNRYLDSGGNIGSWATNEIAPKQIEPLLAAMEQELALSGGASHQAQAGVMSALQFALQLRFPSAFESLKNSKPGKAVGTEAKSMMELYQSEDEVFRLAAWLKAKEDGLSDMEAGKLARRSFLDYNINAPWVQAMRNSALPFVSYTYRAIPKLLDIAGNKPHKLMKLMLVAGALNALGVLLSGGDDDKERKLLPEEKAGKVWGMVPKLIRMPWNDANASPVYLDIRRFIPVGDVFDVGANHAAIPLLPMMTPGGPLVILGEVVLDKTGFTGKPITLETDTPAQQTAKVMDYLYKAFMPNVIGLPGTYASTGVFDAVKGKTDAFGRERSVAQAMASSFGVKLASYPADVLRRNEISKMMAQTMEIDKNISTLKRQRMTNSITAAEFEKQVRVEQEKKQAIRQATQEKLGN